MFIFGTLLVFLAGLAQAMVIERAADADTFVRSDFMGALTCALGMICMGGVLFLVAYILWLVGLYQMYVGRKEYGRAHSLKVYRAVSLAVIFVFLIVASEIMGFATFGVGSSADPQVLMESLRSSAVALGLLDIVRNIVLGLGIVLLAVELCDERYQRILWASFIVTIVVTATGVAITVGSLYAIDSSSLELEELAQLSNMSSFALGLCFIPFIMYLSCYRHAYNRVRNEEVWRLGSTLAGEPSRPWERSGYERICSNCNSYPQEGDVYCAYCGVKLE